MLPAGLHGDPRRDDGLYGKRYWLEHQTERGLPDISERARTDLSERCVFWLERLLESVRPPGRALEIGCGHGAFVSILRELGFDATGIDLSPWVVEFAHTTFGAPVRQGTLETVDVEPGLACIAAFDVLEHLVDPLDTMRRCARLLAPDGVLLLQTPCYRGEGPDWAMFQPDEHVYLFSEASVRDLLGRTGFRDVEVRPSLFPYDMWIAATPGTLTHHAPGDDVDSERWRLPASFRALLDLDAQAHALRRSLTEANRDRAERLCQIEELTEVARKADADRIREVEALLAQIEELTAIARKAEADQLAQAQALTAQIEELTAIARKAEADQLAQAQALTAQIEELTAMARKAEVDRLAEIRELTRLLQESEADRAARLDVIRGAEVQILTLRNEIESLRSRLEQMENPPAPEP